MRGYRIVKRAAGERLSKELDALGEHWAEEPMDYTPVGAALKAENERLRQGIRNVIEVYMAGGDFGACIARLEDLTGGQQS